MAVSMLQHWKKLGLLLGPDTPSPSWMVSHFSVPFLASSEMEGSEKLRVYFSARDRQNRAHLAWSEFDSSDFHHLRTSVDPMMAPGEIGFFDDSGVMGCQILDIGSVRYLFYQGWNVGGSVPFRNSIGVGKWNARWKSFERLSNGPVLDRSPHDPCFVATPWVISWRGGFLMYYLSCIRWEPTPSGYKHHYNIKIAESEDALQWKATGRIAIDFASPGEYAISVPRVFEEGGKFKMYYSYRGGFGTETYRIGYAESEDGLTWVRLDKFVIFDVSASGWDAEMVCYPFIFDRGRTRYMLYNGNGYGKSGFGIAALSLSEGE